MTAAAMAAMIGRKAFLAYGGINIEVYITDVKERWGKMRYQIRPVAGYGSTWVESLVIPDNPGERSVL